MNRLPHLAAAILAAAISTTAAAGCVVRDPGPMRDNVRHLAAGFVMGGAVAVLADSRPAGLAAGLAVGVAKELADLRPGHTCSLQDLAVTLAGAAIGAQLGGALLTFDGRAVRLRYSTAF